MKKVFIAVTASTLLSTAAFAADFGVINQPAPANYIPASNWTGLYAGIFGGVASSNLDLGILSGGTGVLDIGFTGGGMLGGVQIGADYQWDNFVLGAVADIALTNIGSEVNFSVPGAAPSIDGTVSSRLTHIGTLRARAGFLPTEDVLIYAHGGVAYAGTEQNASISIGGVPTAATGLLNPNHWGYTVGAGLEYRVTESISFQTEYAYVNLGTQTIYSDPGLGIDLDQSLHHHQVKAGVNFRF
ncbi:outer membrane beta-barrel protein [Devosia sp. YIM 151766]|uniref:outer membrane protein n=1 Tax=Devosia sp. YIM 151766 TaxID=3017325 RepID=UPI00255CDFB6|nr:outer membrane beta-barrel protein [Devosia sp. YIM 151766]WIY54168.1 outer membrane beta-barrel protein [Devosia sp. YIM 151766]